MEILYTTFQRLFFDVHLQLASEITEISVDVLMKRQIPSINKIQMFYLPTSATLPTANQKACVSYYRQTCSLIGGRTNIIIWLFTTMMELTYYYVLPRFTQPYAFCLNMLQ